LTDKKYGGNYPISVINSWINGSAGDTRKKRPEDNDNDNDDWNKDCMNSDNAEEPEDLIN